MRAARATGGGLPARRGASNSIRRSSRGQDFSAFRGTRVAVNAKWFDDEITDRKLALQAFEALEKHFPEAEADYLHDKKHCTKWSSVCWEIGRSIRLRLDKQEKEKSLGRVLADLADFCSTSRAFARLLFELSKDGQLSDRVIRMLPVQAHLPAILQHLAELQRLQELHEADLRRMDQMGY